MFHFFVFNFLKNVVCVMLSAKSHLDGTSFTSIAVIYKRIIASVQTSSLQTTYGIYDASAIELKTSVCWKDTHKKMLGS